MFLICKYYYIYLLNFRSTLQTSFSRPYVSGEIYRAEVVPFVEEKAGEANDFVDTISE